MDLGYITVTNEVTMGFAAFKSESNNKGELNFEQPFLVGDTWNVKIWGFNVDGGAIPQQTIEIDVPQNEVPANGYFYWGNVMKYIADKIKKKLCPTCS